MFFEGDPLPSAYLLNLCVAVARQGQCVCAPSLQGVHVDTVDRDALLPWVAQLCCGVLEALADVVVRDIHVLAGCEIC